MGRNHRHLLPILSAPLPPPHTQPVDADALPCPFRQHAGVVFHLWLEVTRYQRKTITHKGEGKKRTRNQLSGTGAMFAAFIKDHSEMWCRQPGYLHCCMTPVQVNFTGFTYSRGGICFYVTKPTQKHPIRERVFFTSVRFKNSLSFCFQAAGKSSRNS